MTNFNLGYRDEIILAPKVKIFSISFCLLGILGTFSLLIPAVQNYFLPLVENTLINYKTALMDWEPTEFINWEPTALINWISGAQINWVPICMIPSLTFFLIVLILTVIKKAINTYEIFIFIFFIIQLLCVFSFNMDGNAQTSYLLSFRYGFAHRMFIGTIMDIISGGYVSSALVFCFAFCSTIWLLFFVSIIIGHLIKKSADKAPVLLLTIIYLTSSIAIQSYFFRETLGRMEIYVLLFMFIILSIGDKKYWCWFIPVLCLMSVATHLVVVFFYIPFIFIIFLYRYFKQQDKNEKKLLIITTLSIIVSFIYFVFFSKLTLVFQNGNMFIEVLKNKTDIEHYAMYLDFDYFSSITDAYRYTVSYFQNRYNGEIFFRFYCIIQNLPLFLFFILFWRTCIKVEQKKTIKLIFLFSMLLPVLSIPVFIIFADWGRWIIMLLTVQFMLVFYFLYRQDNAVTLTMNKFIVFVKKYYFIFIIYIMVSIFLGPIEQIYASHNFQRFMRFFEEVLKILTKIF